MIDIEVFTPPRRGSRRHARATRAEVVGVESTHVTLSGGITIGVDLAVTNPDGRHRTLAVQVELSDDARSLFEATSWGGNAGIVEVARRVAIAYLLELGASRLLLMEGDSESARPGHHPVRLRVPLSEVRRHFLREREGSVLL